MNQNQNIELLQENMSWITDIFKGKSKYVDFPKDTSWFLNDDLSVNINNIKRCKLFQDLKEIKHSKRWHKEGNPLNHTLLVAKEMYEIINGQLCHLTTRDKKILMIAAICHDLGKLTTTYFDESENDWKCRNHGAAGERLTRNLIFDEPDYWMREEICWLVRWHMQFHHFLDQPYDKNFSTLTTLSQGNSSVEKLLWLNVADSIGSISSEGNKGSIKEKFNAVKDMADIHGCFTKPYRGPKQTKENFNVYIMIGVPGCGKDTYIQKFLPNIESICRDDIREEMTYGKVEGRKLQFDNTKESIVTDKVNERIKKCCEEKRSFVINQTNVKKKYRTQLKEVILKYDRPNIVYVYVEAPSIEACKERRGHGKWDSIIDRMWGDFEFPDRSECDYLIFYKQQDNKIKVY